MPVESGYLKGQHKISCRFNLRLLAQDVLHLLSRRRPMDEWIFLKVQRKIEPKFLLSAFQARIW